MQTLGDLVDQLITVNIKLFMNQESIQNNSYLEMSGLEAKGLITRSKTLNNQRAVLIDELNRKLGAVVKGLEPVEFPKEKT